jgi:hypothetical protein
MRLNQDLMRPTARAAHLGVVAGGPLLGLLLLGLFSLVRHPIALLMILIGLVMVAPAGYLLDDPAADLLAPSPSTLAKRRLARLSLGVPVMAGGWLIALSRGSYLEGYADLPRWALTVEIAAFAAFALAAAAIAARRGDKTPGLTGASGLFVMVALLFVARQAVPSSWPIPELQPNLHAHRWWWVLGGSVALLAWASRDPLARHRQSRIDRCAFRVVLGTSRKCRKAFGQDEDL